ncbi:MAG: single-stranded-DNA-specific exonuclease RecJ, partial [Patescibacteria group bacterium]
LIARLKEFEPFGLGNPTPVFKSTNLSISNAKSVGQTGKHLKFRVGDFDAIFFNATKLPGNPVDIVYSVEEDTWNGQSKLQLIVKDIREKKADF